MTTIAYDGATRTLYADTRSTQYRKTKNGEIVPDKQHPVEHNNLKLFRTFRFIAGGSGDYTATTYMLARLVAGLPKDNNDLCRGSTTWHGSRMIVVTEDCAAVLTCKEVHRWLLSDYAKWSVEAIYQHEDVCSEWIVIGSGAPFFRMAVKKGLSVPEAFAYTSANDPATGGQLVSVSLKGDQLITDHGLILPRYYFDICPQLSRMTYSDGLTHSHSLV